MTRSISKPAPKVRQTSFDDYAQIARLQAEHGLGGWSFEEWQHLWSSNPTYIGLEREWPIGWVLEADCGIVGYFGNIPVPHVLSGKSLIAACAHSWVVAHAYRGYSLALLNQYFKQTGADLWLANTVGEESCEPLEAFGASQIPTGVWDRSCVWITTYRSFVAGWLARKKYPLPSFFAQPISAALFIRDAVKRRRIQSKDVQNGKPEIVCCEAFDARFDSFWEKLQQENPNKLLAVRSRSILEWHFRFALRENRVWIVSVGDSSHLCAYAIFLLKRSSADGVKRLVLVDFQALADKTHLFYSVLAWALDRCRRDRIHLLETIGLRVAGVGDVATLAPYHVQQGAWSFWYKACDRSLAGVLKDPNAWAPSLLDGDASVVSA